MGLKFSHGELVSIDIARGLAALSVFIYHYGIGNVLAKYTGLEFFKLISWPGANIAVPLFFVLSGYCIHRSEWKRLQIHAKFSVQSYFRRRFWRIYPIYAVALLFSVLINYLRGHADTGEDIIVHALMLQVFSESSFNSINLVMWTIAVECYLYAIYPLWLKIRMRFGLGTGVLLVMIVNLLSCMVTFYIFDPQSNVARLFFLNTWCGWVAGAALYELLESNHAWFKSAHWWVTGLLVWGIVMLMRPEYGMTDLWRVFDAPVLMLLAVWPLCGLVLADNHMAATTGLAKTVVAAIGLIGAASYSLYLFHIPLIELRNIIQAGADPGFSRIIFQAIWFLVILLMCRWTYLLIERPMLRIGHRLSEHHDPAHLYIRERPDKIRTGK